MRSELSKKSLPVSNMGSDATPVVSVVVPCRNEKDYIESCIGSILAQEVPFGALEVVVADGMSDDGTRDILNRLAAEDHRLQIVENPSGAIPAGLNQGIRAARAKIIIRMDAHTNYASDYIKECVAVLQETGADNIGGPWIARGEGLIGRAIAAVFQSTFAVGGALGHQPDYEGELDTVYLGCWPVNVFERIGLFDEELLRSEDDEFNLRLARAGGKIWQSPRIKSWYHTRESLRSLLQQQIQYGYWKVRVIQKHKIPASFRHLVPGCFVLVTTALALASLWSRSAMWSWIVIAGVYLVCNLAASLVMASRSEWRLFPILPFVFGCYHIGYGYGFLRGVVDFLIFRRAPRNAYAKLTRVSGEESRGSPATG